MNSNIQRKTKLVLIRKSRWVRFYSRIKMQKIKTYLLISVSSFIFLGCNPTFKDSYSGKAEGRKLKLRFHDKYKSTLEGRAFKRRFNDAYGGSSGRTNKIRFRDSYGGVSGRKRQLGFKDSYGGIGGRQSPSNFKDSYRGSNSANKSITPKWRDSYSGGGGRRKQVGFKDSYGGSSGRNSNFKHKDSFERKSKTNKRGYRDPDKKWYHFRGNINHKGKKYKERKSYSGSRKEHTIPKKKKKVHRSTKFEGAK